MEFAQAIGVVASQISKWECRKSVVSSRSLERVFRRLGLDLSLIDGYKANALKTVPSHQYPSPAGASLAMEIREAPAPPYGEPTADPAGVIAFLQRKREEASRDLEGFDRALRELGPQTFRPKDRGYTGNR